MDNNPEPKAKHSFFRRKDSSNTVTIDFTHPHKPTCHAEERMWRLSQCITMMLEATMEGVMKGSGFNPLCFSSIPGRCSSHNNDQDKWAEQHV